MCGITGILHKNDRPVDLSVLKRMTRRLAHRGPDDEGYFVCGPAGLGHRRLSIIDLSGGRQPMTTPDGRYTIVFNGEIYNFPEIRAGLEKRGVSFLTHSDTEVLLYLYAEKGAECLGELNGMFAFAVWDKQDKKLFAARDRMGKKPFYYWDTPSMFSFASECKAFGGHPDFLPRLDLDAARCYFQYEYVPSPLSVFRGVNKLPPAHYLAWHNGSISITPYWNIPLGKKNGPSKSQNDIEKNILGLLDRAVERRLMSDVPLGVFLSGGIDSSAVVALMARHMEGKHIKTFSIGFDEASYDESDYARFVAKKFSTDHHVEILTSSKLPEILPQVTDFLDEPFADYSIIPTYLLAGFTRKKVTVALGGDGGDELFAGYPTFFADRLAEIFHKFPKIFQRMINRMANALPVSLEDLSFDFKLKQFLYGAAFPPVLRNQVWLGAFHHDELEKLFSPSGDSRDPLSLIGEVMHGCQSKNIGDRMLYFYQKFYLADDILVKTDRASMAASLEVRAPFLDVGLVEYVSGLPYSLKQCGLKTKLILKKALEKILPKEIVYRKKKGFGIPMALWLKNNLRKKMCSELDRRKIAKEGIFDPDYVDMLVEGHLSGKKNNRKQLFSLLMFEWWLEKYLL